MLHLLKGGPGSGKSSGLFNGGPLVAALLAPMATLYDIPALTQSWYSLNGEALPDPLPSLVLSSFSLACSVVALAVLVARFTIRSPERWRHAIIASASVWCLKSALSIANLITFGATRRNGPGFSYAQGFWSSVMSTILGGIVAILLLLHSVHMVLKLDQAAPGRLHLDGRVFILSELMLVGLLAIQALIFSQIEGWMYLDGLYFSIVSALTIGFGDFIPATPAGKVLLFPFVLADIALLSNQVTLIVNVSSRNTRRYQRMLHAAEEYTTAASRSDSKDTLLRSEAQRLRHLVSTQRRAREMVDLAISIGILAIFWIVNAIIYHYTEGWTFGNAFYFSYIFFLTVGYGSDFAPASPAGRTVFIFWALLAVPVMTNFVTATVQTLTSNLSRTLTERTQEKREEWNSELDTYFVPHSRLIAEAKRRANEKDEDDTNGDSLAHCEHCQALDSSNGRLRLQMTALLQNGIQLEAQARSIIIDQIEAGSKPWLLLNADRNVQRRDSGLPWNQMESTELDSEHTMSDVSLIDRVARYRRLFAEWSVLSGQLLGLDEQEFQTSEGSNMKNA